MNNSLSNNLIILIRHGERMDRLGLKPSFHVADSELSPNGLDQAYEIGKKISEFLTINYPNHIKIKIYSSPFVRTIQTSKHVLRGLSRNFEMEDCINIDYYFSQIGENSEHEGPDYKRFIVLLNNPEMIQKDIGETSLKFLNEPEGLLPDKIESNEECLIRLKKGLKNLLFNFNQGTIFNNVHIIVSHAQPINQMNGYLNFPGELGWSNVKYCNCYIYEIEVDATKDDITGKFINSFYP